MKNFLNWFIKPKKNTNNTITFLLDNHNEPYIYIDIANTSPDNAKKFAEMLFGMNCGLYISSILALLVNVSKTDKNIGVFVSNVITDWQDAISLNMQNASTNDEPTIKPTEFYKYVK